jgi:hypothetical protein
LFTYRNAQITVSVNDYIAMRHKSRSRYVDGGDEKGQMAARTGYVLRYASHDHGSESAPGGRPEAKQSCGSGATKSRIIFRIAVDTVFEGFQGRAIATAMCTTRVYQSGG